MTDGPASDDAASGPAHVHGRFQPFHDEHLDYVRWAAAAHSGDRLLVGVTNADTAHTAESDADPGRHRPRNNPFRYHERHRMIRAALESADVATETGTEIDVVPFPINRPELWTAYAPPGTIHYVNVLETWHERKVELLREHGRTVRSKRGTRRISGTGIRKAMADGDVWADRVPGPVAAYVRDHGLEARVRQLYDEGE